LTGNGDAHAKNFSVLQNEAGEWQVSSAYDVPCSYVYGDTTMALSIGGRSGSNFGLKHFLALGDGLGVPARAVNRALADLVARVDRWLPEIDRLPFDRGQLDKLRRVIDNRRGRLSAS
jgi:serine/threonine-protein kinase HipA